MFCLGELRWGQQSFDQGNIVEVEFSFAVDLERPVVGVVEWLYEGVALVEALLIGGLSAAHLLLLMNFLNKKYTSLHASTPYHTNSRSFLPAASTVRENTPALTAANCENHPNEILRHLCLECVELLCAECIGEHL